MILSLILNPFMIFKIFECTVLICEHNILLLQIFKVIDIKNSNNIYYTSICH